MPDSSDQADDHARQAGHSGAATQPINEQANHAAASLQPTTDAHKDSAVQTQLKVRRLSLQLRQKLQVRMSLSQAAALALPVKIVSSLLCALLLSHLHQ